MAWCLTTPSHYLSQCWPISWDGMTSPGWRYSELISKHADNSDGFVYVSRFFLITIMITLLFKVHLVGPDVYMYSMYIILIKILSHSLKFSQRVEKLPDFAVVKLSHQDAVQWSETYKCTSWLHKLDHCIKRFNCTLNDSATKLQHAMEHDYKQAWLITIQNGGKLSNTQFSNKIFLLKTICFVRLLLIVKTLHAL